MTEWQVHRWVSAAALGGAWEGRLVDGGGGQGGRMLDSWCGMGANRQGVGEVGVCAHGNFVVFGGSIAGMVGHPLSKWN